MIVVLSCSTKTEPQSEVVNLEISRLSYNNFEVSLEEPLMLSITADDETPVPLGITTSPPLGVKFSSNMIVKEVIDGREVAKKDTSHQLTLMKLVDNQWELLVPLHTSKEAEKISTKNCGNITMSVDMEEDQLVMDYTYRLAMND